jgi:hypothetical protein
MVICGEKKNSLTTRRGNMDIATIKDRLSHYAVYLLLTLLLLLLFRGVWSLIFKPQTQVNKPTAVAIGNVQKGAIDQTSTQIKVEGEKPWEASVGVGAFRYDQKDGYGGMVMLKRRF